MRRPIPRTCPTAVQSNGEDLTHWGQGGFVRHIVVAIVVLLGLTLPVRTSQACSCGDLFVATSIGAADTHDAGTPVVFLADGGGGDPVLLAFGEELEVRKTEIVNDALCGANVVAYLPVDPVEVGSTLSLVDPEREEWVNQISDDEWAEIRETPYFDRERYRYEYEMQVVEPRPRFEAQLSLRVSWESWWPHEFSGALCAANELLPYESRGIAHVEVEEASGSEIERPEFYVSARVLLPGGEAYQEVGSSDVDDEGRSRASVVVPLTHAGETPECVFVTVYDHFLEPVFEQEICGDPDSRDSWADAHAYETFTAQLRKLHWDPPVVESEASVGCSYAVPGDSRARSVRGSPFALLLALCAGLIAARRWSSM